MRGHDRTRFNMAETHQWRCWQCPGSRSGRAIHSIALQQWSDDLSRAFDESLRRRTKRSAFHGDDDDRPWLDRKVDGQHFVGKLLGAEADRALRARSET